MLKQRICPIGMNIDVCEAYHMDSLLFHFLQLCLGLQSRVVESNPVSYCDFNLIKTLFVAARHSIYTLPLVRV